MTLSLSLSDVFDEEIKEVFGDAFDTSHKPSGPYRIKPEGRLVMAEQMRCGGCGSKFQHDKPEDVGFISEEEWEEAKFRQQLKPGKSGQTGQRGRAQEEEVDAEEGEMGWSSLSEEERMQMALDRREAQLSGKVLDKKSLLLLRDQEGKRGEDLPIVGYQDFQKLQKQIQPGFLLSFLPF